MLIDDRLATVLRHRAAGMRAARTQFRQLIDLLGSRERGSSEKLRASAWLRLAALGESIPAKDRAEIIADPSSRVHSPQLAAHFAEDEPAVAAAALARAQLTEDDWEALIPRLPIRARGFLRFRNDLPPGAVRLLDRLGISDRGLPGPPEPVVVTETAAPASARLSAANDSGSDHDSASEPAAPDTPVREPSRREGTAIGSIVERIEAFRRERSQRRDTGDTRSAPLLPLEDDPANAPPPLIGFAFTTDTAGRIDWADPQVAPSVLHMGLAPILPDPARRALAGRQPIAAAPVTMDGAPIVAGEWVCDARPRFTRDTGVFYGYAGRMRRAPRGSQAAAEPGTAPADTVRQMLHELRTPVNAIQGFAELIQQQLFGPVPHEYRALAATIAGDAARMLAGFDEIDRLAKLESGALELDTGATDHAAVIRAVAQRLGPMLETRDAGFSLDLAEDVAVGLDHDVIEALTWRILAAIAGALGPGEKASLSLVGDSDTSWLEATLPQAMRQTQDIFSPEAPSGRQRGQGPVSAGAFGPGFALRLARAEARAGGGDLARGETSLVLTLPRLTSDERNPSAGGTDEDGGSGRAVRSS